jgi:hypothetical protein
LRAAAGALVFQQLWQVNKVDFQIVQPGHAPVPVTFAKTDTVNFIGDFQPHRFMSHADDFSLSQEQSGLEFRQSEAEFAEGADNPFRIFSRKLHKNIKVAGVTDMAVLGHGMAADDQIPNRVCV